MFINSRTAECERHTLCATPSFPLLSVQANSFPGDQSRVAQRLALFETLRPFLSSPALTGTTLHPMFIKLRAAECERTTLCATGLRPPEKSGYHVTCPHTVLLLPRVLIKLRTAQQKPQPPRCLQNIDDRCVFRLVESPKAPAKVYTEKEDHVSLEEAMDVRHARRLPPRPKAHKHPRQAPQLRR